MEVSGQLCTKVTLLLRKEPLVPIWIEGFVGLRAGLDLVAKRKESCHFLWWESDPSYPV